jgi:hypothetical protein
MAIMPAVSSQTLIAPLGFEIGVDDPPVAISAKEPSFKWASSDLWGAILPVAESPPFRSFPQNPLVKRID